MRRRGWVAVASLVGVAIGGCSDGRDTSVESALVRYVSALNEADFEAAMQARCSSSRVSSENRQLFLDQLRQLKNDAGGQLTIVDLEDVRDRRLKVTEDTLVEHELRFRIELPQGKSTPIHVGTVREGGVDKLCAVATEKTWQVSDELSATDVQVNPRQLGDARAITSSAVSSLGFNIVEDRKSLGRDQLGVDGWTTAWSNGHAGGRITAIRYQDRQQAVDAAWRTLSAYGRDATSKFSLSSMPNAIGLRYAGYAWTWIQPADFGPQIDAAVAVYDTLVITMNVTNLPPTEDHSALAKVSEAVTTQMNA